jgi:hypothetical protein
VVAELAHLAFLAVSMLFQQPAATTDPGQRPRPPSYVTAHLEWHLEADATDCMRGVELERATEVLLGRSVFQRQEGALVRIKGRVAGGADNRWRADLTLMAGDGRVLGSRELTTESKDCRALDDSLPVVLALMVDIDREHVILQIPPPPPPPPAAAPTEKIVATDAAVTSTGGGWDGAVAVGGLISRGALPGFPFGVQVGATVTPPRFAPLELRGRFWVPSVEQRGDEGTDIWAWEVGAAVCPVLFAGSRLSFDACAGPEVGRFYARGVGAGLDRPRRAEGSLLGVAVGGRARLRVARSWEIRLAVEGVTPLIQNRLVFTVPEGDEVPVFEASRFAPRAELAIVRSLSQ